jgi:hypothetical protein
MEPQDHEPALGWHRLDSNRRARIRQRLDPACASGWVVLSAISRTSTHARWR